MSQADIDEELKHEGALEVMDAPDFLKRATSRSRSRSTKRGFAPHRTYDSESHLMQSTYNQDYRHADTRYSHTPTVRGTIKVNDVVHKEDFNVCPKYLYSTTDFDDLESPKADVSHETWQRRTQNTDSRERRKEIQRPYEEDKLDFIENYNRLLRENKVISRKLGHMKEKIRVLHEEDIAEEPHNRKPVDPHPRELVETPSNSKYLSPIQPKFEKNGFLSPERQGTTGGNNNSTLNLGLSPQNKPDCCNHVQELQSRIDQITGLEGQIQSLKNKLETVKSREADLQKVAERAMDEVKQLSKLLDQRTEEHKERGDVSQHESESLRQALNELREENNKLKYGFSSMVPEEDKHAELIRKVSKLENEAGERNTELERTMQERDKALSELEEFNQKYGELQKRLKEAEDALKNREALPKSQTDAIYPGSPKKSEVEANLQAEIAKLREENSNLRKQSKEPKYAQRPILTQSPEPMDISTKHARRSYEKPKSHGVAPLRNRILDSASKQIDHMRDEIDESMVDNHDITISEKIRRVNESALNLRNQDNSKISMPARIEYDLGDSTDVVNRLLVAKDVIISMLKKELKNRSDELQNEIDSLRKDKEEIQLELHRKVITTSTYNEMKVDRRLTVEQV